MTALYRIVHFVPDFRIAARVPLGALLRRRAAVESVVPGNADAVACVGDPRAQALFVWLRARLVEVRSFDEVSEGMRPHVVLDDARAVPAAIEDPVEWLQSLLSPVTATAKRASTSRPQRASRGRRYLDNVGLGRFLQPGRLDRRAWEGLGWVRPGRSTAAPVVSQWVRGPDHLLLMEPLVADASAARRDLVDVGRDFHAIAHMHGELPSSEGAAGALQRLEYVAYLLPGGPTEQRADLAEEAREVLPGEAKLVDMSVVHDRRALAERMRATCEQGRAELV